MDKPTDKQVKEFWEWCGLKWEMCHWNCPFSPDEHTALTPKSKHVHLVYPDGSVLLNTTGYYSPLIDLNNLFKYAVPKLEHLKLIDIRYDSYYGYQCGIVFYVKGLQDRVMWSKKYSDPALALFWAIYETIKNESKE